VTGCCARGNERSGAMKCGECVGFAGRLSVSHDRGAGVRNAPEGNVMVSSFNASFMLRYCNKCGFCEVNTRTG
jgi:hypothetical protein